MLIPVFLRESAATTLSCRARILERIKHDLVNIAPAPVFARLERFDDRMAYRMKMLRRMFVG